MTSRLPAYRRFASGLPHFLRTPISYDEARSTILRRHEQRGERFLRMVERCVYGNPTSPYLRLLREAGCELGDMVRLLASSDLETLLTTLWTSGIRISFEEFKGRQPVVRGPLCFPVADTDFDNPLIDRGLQVQSGGSSGRPSRMMVDLDFLAERAPYEHILFRLLRIDEVPLALWYPALPVSIGLSNSLRYAKIGKPPDRWFDMRMPRETMPAWHGWALAALVRLSWLTPAPLARPTRAPLAEPGIVVAWMIEALRRHGRCAVQSNVSGIVRLCREAAGRGVDLRGVQFITGSEPLTPAKHAEIIATNAAVQLRYQAVDLGSIGAGCGAPADIDELHLLSDTIALITPGAPGGTGVSPVGTPVDAPRPLWLTSTLQTGPKVVINVDLGDRAVVRRRSCGCPYEALGFDTHLSQVRSATRSTVEGLALPYAELTRIAEEVLPAALGGSVVDYQWIEDEDPERGSLTCLWLRIAPQVGAIDGERVRRLVIDEIARPDGAHRFFAQLLDAARAIRIVREPPRTTPAGKTPAVMRGREADVAPGSARPS